jgi:L-cysteine desulfidase
MYTAKEILISQIKPALGCTEPAAIALNAAYLKDLTDVDGKINLTINTNLLKNAMYVPIPNTGRRFGVKFAFALGLLCGNKENGLNVFETVTEECIKKAAEMEKNINLEIVKGSEIFIKSSYKGYEVLTKTFHDNIENIKTPKKEIKLVNRQESADTGVIEKWLKNQDFEVLYDLVEKEDDFSFIEDVINMNMKLSKIGLEEDCALNIGKSFTGNDVKSKIISYTTSASDARMEGVNFPAMSLVGSGNHGISATLPVWIYASEKGFSKHETFRALALSMLITVYVKLFIGRLSAICGAAFASGCGVAGAISYLESKNRNISKNAVSYLIQTINGVICDGAKMGCSLKVMLGAQSGYEAAVFALENKPVFSDGILEENITNSIKNLKNVSDAMSGVDDAIVDVMRNKVI